MIFTSYFGNVKKLKGLELVSIAAQTPKWFEGERELDFAPSYEILYAIKRGRITEAQFEEMYRAELDHLDLNIVSQKLEEYDNGNTCFLCYEKPDDFCHRHVFRKWVEERLSLEIKEWTPETEIV